MLSPDVREQNSEFVSKWHILLEVLNVGLMHHSSYSSVGGATIFLGNPKNSPPDQTGVAGVTMHAGSSDEKPFSK